MDEAYARWKPYQALCPTCQQMVGVAEGTLGALRGRLVTIAHVHPDKGKTCIGSGVRVLRINEVRLMDLK